MVGRNLNQFSGKYYVDGIHEKLAYLSFVMNIKLVILDAFYLAKVNANDSREALINWSNSNEVCPKINQKEAVHNCVRIIVVIKNFFPSFDEPHKLVFSNFQCFLDLHISIVILHRSLGVE